MGVLNFYGEEVPYGEINALKYWYIFLKQCLTYDDIKITHTFSLERFLLIVINENMIGVREWISIYIQ